MNRNKNILNRRFFIKSLSVQAFSLLSLPKLLKAATYKDCYNRGGESDLSKVSGLIHGEESATWLFTGDSITQGAKHTNGLRAFPEIFGERVRWEMGRGYDVVVNTAISGHTSQNIINDFERRITQYQPQVVFLMIGMNDAAVEREISTKQFSENLFSLVEHIRRIEAIPILISPNRIITEQSPQRSGLDEYITEMKKVAHQRKTILVDNWSIWNNELQEKFKGKALEMLLNDPIHPNGYGHTELAIAIFKELSIFDKASPACINPIFK